MSRGLETQAQRRAGVPRATDKEESPRLLVLLLHPGSKSRMAPLDLCRLLGHMGYLADLSGMGWWMGGLNIPASGLRAGFEADSNSFSLLSHSGVHFVAMILHLWSLSGDEEQGRRGASR